MSGNAQNGRIQPYYGWDYQSATTVTLDSVKTNRKKDVVRLPDTVTKPELANSFLGLSTKIPTS